MGWTWSRNLEYKYSKVEQNKRGLPSKIVPLILVTKYKQEIPRLVNPQGIQTGRNQSAFQAEWWVWPYWVTWSTSNELIEKYKRARCNKLNCKWVGNSSTELNHNRKLQAANWFQLHQWNVTVHRREKGAAHRVVSQLDHLWINYFRKPKPKYGWLRVRICALSKLKHSATRIFRDQ